MSAGVYQIRNTNNGHRYIGSTKDLKVRKYHHFALLRKGKHANSYLQRAFNKYGEDAFRFEILFEAKYPTRMDLFEQYYLDTNKPEYNVAQIASTAFNRLGVKPSEEAKQKTSQTLKKKFIGRGNPFYGKKHSAETRQKIRQALKGKRNGEANPFYGKKHSTEARIKISERLKGNHYNRKLSDANVRQIRTLLTQGRTQSEVAKLFNISQSAISNIKLNKRYKDVS